MQVRQTDKSEGPIYLSPTQSSTQVLHATQPNNQHAHEPGVIAPPALACSAACRGLRILHALDARRPHSPATTAACWQPRPLPHGCEGRAVHSAVRTSLCDALLAARSGWRDRAPRPPPRAQRAGWGALADGGEHRARALGRQVHRLEQVADLVQLHPVQLGRLRRAPRAVRAPGAARSARPCHAFMHIMQQEHTRDWMSTRQSAKDGKQV